MASPKLIQRLTGMVPSSAPGSKNRRRNSNYPVLPFHMLRFAQLISSMGVAAITFYFIYHLRHDHYGVPWTFILLAAVSGATIIALTFTIVLHCLTGLSPYLNVFTNAVLFIVWTVSFSLLSWWSSGTISHSCNTDNWHNDMGIRVCRLYKALFGFAMIGFMFTFFAILLDLYVLGLNNRRGKYNQMRDLDFKDRSPDRKDLPQEGLTAARRMSADVWNADTLDADHDHPSAREIDPLAPPKAQFNDAQKNVAKEGYEAPPGQFNYDTGYRGNADIGASRGQGYEGLRTG